MYINNPDHMTQIATMLIYGNTFRRSYSLDIVDRFQRNVAWSIND